MKAKRKSATKAKRGPVRLSRQTLNKTLIDLTERLQKQLWLADAIVTVNVPNDHHTLMEHQLRTVFGIQLTALLSGMQDAHGLAKILRDAATRGREVVP